MFKNTSRLSKALRELIHLRSLKEILAFPRKYYRYMRVTFAISRQKVNLLYRTERMQYRSKVS